MGRYFEPPPPKPMVKRVKRDSQYGCLWGIWVPLCLVSHVWFFFHSTIDGGHKLLLLSLVLGSSALNQFIHNKSNESLSVAFRTYFVTFLLVCVGLLTFPNFGNG